MQVCVHCMCGSDAYHLEHQPSDDFCLLSGVFGQESALGILLSKMDHDGTRLKYREVSIIMIHCKCKTLSGLC